MKAKTGETQRLIKRLKEARKAVEYVLVFLRPWICLDQLYGDAKFRSSITIGLRRNKSAEQEVKDESSEEAKPAHKKKQELTEEDVAKFELELELVKVRVSPVNYDRE